MLLDGDELLINDRVFHITAGGGVVETIEKGNARVRMDSGGILNMGEDGYVGKKKVFFWSNPIYFYPRKNGMRQYELTSEMLLNALAIMEERLRNV